MDIQAYIEEQVKEIDVKEEVFAIIHHTVVKIVREDAQNEIKRIMNDEISALINREIAIILAGPVTVNDGWSKRETYPSFEDMFKKLFKERLDKSYDMKSTIQREVQQMAEKLYKKKVGIIKARIVEEITAD